MKVIHHFLVLLFATMLLSACRTAHKATKEVTATQTAETSQSSVADQTSFAALLSSLSLRADSIVLWLQDGETVQAATCSEEDRQRMPADSSIRSQLNAATVQFVDSPIPTARPSARGRSGNVSKILISGVHLDSKTEGKKVTAYHARDSLSARESQDTSLSEKEEEKPPNLWNLVLQFALIYTILGLLITFGIIALRRAFKLK